MASHSENVAPLVGNVKPTVGPADPVVERSLKDFDDELYQILRNEKKRQHESLELIASENFTSLCVRECLGSSATNKYSEGRPGLRYYGGNEYIDQMESLCERRALEAFGISEEAWTVNVQALSGSPANLAVFLGLLTPGDRIMGLSLPHGGHLSHGFSTPKDPKFTAGAAFYKCQEYHVDVTTGRIDPELLMKEVEEFRPKLLIAGASAYPRAIDWAVFRAAADKVGAYLLVDMAHISGLVATGQHPSPFPFADVVTTTTHKSLRGPRSAMVFVNHERLGQETAAAVHRGVFPGVQGGPHNHQIAALAAQLKEVMTPEFATYQCSVVANAHALAGHFMEAGYTVVTDGTDNHLLLVNTKASRGVTGSKVEHLCDLANISLNKNTVPGDKSPLSPSGIRIGTPAMTSRGCTVEDMAKIFRLVDRVVELCKDIAEEMQEDKSLKGFKAKALEPATQAKIQLIRDDVILFARDLYMPASALPF